ncbi:LytR C-terminal domain-containing protein [Candidatus Latescibacterota bacterium]
MSPFFSGQSAHRPFPGGYAFKITAYLSVTVILLSTSSLAVLYAVRPSPPEPILAREDLRRPEPVIRVALLNGCGRSGLAFQFAGILRSRGYDVMNGQGDNADSFDFDVSVVVDRKGNRELAERVARDLGIALIIKQYATDPYVLEDIDIILGRDWNTLPMAKEVPRE